MTRVSVPVRVVGTDVTDGPAAVWAQHAEVPHRVVHGTGHWVDIERPDEVVAETRLLLDAVS